MAEEKLLLMALRGEVTRKIPFWFMRQAGRYLPEYREIRSTTSGFLDLCFSPEKAAEVTLQPLRRFGMDAAILFSDILVIPYGLGVDVRFLEGEGPLVAVTDTAEKIAALDVTTVRSKLAPVAETVRLVKKDLPPGATLIGFAGAPWTVACYMLQGKSGKEFQTARLFALSQPSLMQQLMDTLTTATIDYLSMQIEAGAEAIQIFDSWAGLLTPSQMKTLVIEPTRTIVEAIRSQHPHIPIIGFPKGAGLELLDYSEDTQVDCVGVDQHTDLDFAIECCHQTVQGNLDPLLIAADKEGALAATKEILSIVNHKNVPFVFNLGHGFIPQTPIENVQAVADYIKQWRRS